MAEHHKHIDEGRQRAAAANLASDLKRASALLALSHIYAQFAQEAAELTSRGIALVSVGFDAGPPALMTGPNHIEAALNFGLSEGVTVSWSATEPEKLRIDPKYRATSGGIVNLPHNGDFLTDCQSIGKKAILMAHQKN